MTVNFEAVIQHSPESVTVYGEQWPRAVADEVQAGLRAAIRALPAKQVQRWKCGPVTVQASGREVRVFMGSGSPIYGDREWAVELGKALGTEKGLGT